MKTNKKESGIPEFKSLEEEREYWETRGPLAEGYDKAEANVPKPSQNRTSFLSIRLTGEELSDLQEVAEAFNTTASQLVRGAIVERIRRLKSLYERDKQERQRVEEALRHGLTDSPLEKLDIRKTNDNSTLDNALSFWRRIVDQNPRAGLWYLSLLTIQDLSSASDKSVLATLKQLDSILRQSEPAKK